MPRIRDTNTMRRRCLIGLLVLSALASARSARAVTYANASAGLPATHHWDCNPTGFERCRNPADSGGWVGVDLADVDGDGDDDVAAIGRLLFGIHAWLSDGAGNWTESSTGLETDCHGRAQLALSDLDGDGKPDVGTISGINGAPGAWLGDGSGGWRASSTGLDLPGGEGFASGDFDGDGFPDVASSGHFAGHVRAWLGAGTGAWTEASTGLPDGDVWAHRMTAGDLDGDGRDELVDTAYRDAPGVGQGVHAWRLGVDGTWRLFTEIYFDQPWEPVVADLNGDGRMDLVVSSIQALFGDFGNVRAFLNVDGTGAFTDASSGLPSLDWFYAGLAVGDLDNDGDPDIVVGMNEAAGIRVFLNDGTARWTEATGTGLPTVLDTVEALALGDVDRDCRLDVAYAAYSCGVQVYRRSDAPPCSILAEAGPPRLTCLGGAVTLSAAASRACGCAGGARFRWWKVGALSRDWDPSPALTDAPASDALYVVDVACAGNLACSVSDAVLVRVVPPPQPAIDPPSVSACVGDVVTLTATGPWASVSWRTDPPGEDGDGASGAVLAVSPAAATIYYADVTDEFGCRGSASASVTLLPDPLPPTLGASLRVAKSPPAGITLTWLDLAGTWGDFEIVRLPAALGPPTTATMDSVASVAASIPPGVQAWSDPTGQGAPSGLVFLKVRATSPCAGRPGPTAD